MMAAKRRAKKAKKRSRVTALERAQIRRELAAELRLIKQWLATERRLLTASAKRKRAAARLRARERLRGLPRSPGVVSIALPSGDEFLRELLATMADIDRRGRHAGVIPIPEVRRAFMSRGWSRDAFDRSLLVAERRYAVDLKSANDPRRIADPHESIVDPARGHIRYVIARP